MSFFKELWEYRQMLYSMVKKDLKTRYKNSVLGFMWTFLNPLFQLLIYTLLFSVILGSATENYGMFLFVGLVPWLFFSSSLTAGSRSVITYSGLVLKIYFPRIILPLSVVCSSFINMLLTFVVVFAALLVTGVGIGLSVVMLPVVMIIEFFFTLGIVLIVSALDVYLRDIEYILGIVTMAWMYMTPVLYGSERIPERFRTLFYLNPMAGIIESYRNILFYKTMPDFSTMTAAVVFALVSVTVGTLLFNRLQRRFAEEL